KHLHTQVKSGSVFTRTAMLWAAATPDEFTTRPAARLPYAMFVPLRAPGCFPAPLRLVERGGTGMGTRVLREDERTRFSGLAPGAADRLPMEDGDGHGDQLPRLSFLEDLPKHGGVEHRIEGGHTRQDRLAAPDLSRFRIQLIGEHQRERPGCRADS